MSIHRSLVSKSGLGRSRNVLTRYERILEMRKLGNWDEEEGGPYGLPKVKVMKIKKRVKKKKEEEERYHIVQIGLKFEVVQKKKLGSVRKGAPKKYKAQLAKYDKARKAA